MAKENASRFLQLMNEANNRIASRVEEDEIRRKTVGGDQLRIQRVNEKREKAGGALRAREHPRSRPQRARFVLGATPFSGPKLNGP